MYRKKWEVIRTVMEEIAEAVAGLGAQMAVSEMEKKKGKRGKKRGAPKGRRGKRRRR